MDSYHGLVSWWFGLRVIVAAESVIRPRPLLPRDVVRASIRMFLKVQKLRDISRNTDSLSYLSKSYDVSN